MEGVATGLRSSSETFVLLFCGVYQCKVISASPDTVCDYYTKYILLNNFP